MFSKEFNSQIPRTLRLAAPLALSQLGQMLMGLIDTFMVGKLGPQFIGAVGLGNSLFWICGLPCIGLLMALDYLVSFSFGQKDINKCNFWLIQGVYFAILISCPMALGIYFVANNLNWLGIEPQLAIHTRTFLASYCWSLIPFSIFIAFRQYIQSLNKVKIVMVIMLTANALNAFLNWIFIYGHGVKAWGVAGSGAATLITRIIMLAALVIYVFYVDDRENLGLRQIPWRMTSLGMKMILKLGIPSASQMALEVGVFSISTTLAARVGVAALAAHSIVLNVAAFTFMVPLGVSGAAAILVGQAIGRGEKRDARRAGWTSFLLGVGFMVFSAIILFTCGRSLLHVFTQDEEVISLGLKILILASLFQIFDGTQAVGTGALRGLGETRIPMWANLVGYWFVGFPVSLFICFSKSWGIVGLWVGLTLGLIVVATTILLTWIKKTSQF